MTLDRRFESEWTPAFREFAEKHPRCFNCPYGASKVRPKRAPAGCGRCPCTKPDPVHKPAEMKGVKLEKVAPYTYRIVP